MCALGDGRNCRDRAAREGWEVVAEYADRGISGATSNRPDYQRMLAAAFAGEFDVLLVDDLSRLARDDVETKQVIRRFVSPTCGWSAFRTASTRP